MESSNGKNDGCKARGGVNGYGYRQNKHEFACYDTHERVKALVTKWVEDKIDKYTDGQILCYYNTGILTSTCKYHQSALTLN